ncbi:MAG: formylglycine-generating enzyme family protein [Aeromicrobium sp.]|uniref:formylglycine-generating enzyme family protein n=1 Tax=Aeromicrobium sp. TaxID=1871063 RepID=UPI0039E63C14
MTQEKECCCGPAADGRSAAAPVVEVACGGARGEPSGWVRLDGGTFLMGADDALAYPGDGEGPVREVTVEPFEIGATTVTVAEFAQFVEATGHVSDAERFGDSLVFVGSLPDDAPPTRAIASTQWWRVVPGASWRAPEGPGSTVEDRADHPVTHVSQRDALAYARWVGGRLPTEREWEFAARGGLVQQPYPWGGEREPDGERRMNTFEGRFPSAPSRPVGTTPARSFAPNGYGLFNMTGNVWEWTSSPFSARDPQPVLRGGSFLCHDSYCRRYRVSARIANTPDSSLSHTGFRLARSV